MSSGETSTPAARRRRTLPFVFLPVMARLGFKTFVRGLNYWRSLEYPLALDSLDLRKGCSILDIGSAPFSLLPLYLASREEFELHLVDLRDYVLDHGRSLRRLGLSRLLDEGRVRLCVQDARRLTYPAASFDRVTSISTLEHIPGSGDSEAAAEIGRVLRPGGRAFLTVPFAARHEDMCYRPDDVPRAHGPEASIASLFTDSFRRPAEVPGPASFYERHYDRDTLVRRLVEPSGLRLLECRTFTERIAGFTESWDGRPPLSKAVTNWISPLLSLLLISEERGAPRLRPGRSQVAALTLVKDPLRT